MIGINPYPNMISRVHRLSITLLIIVTISVVQAQFGNIFEVSPLL